MDSPRAFKARVPVGTIRALSLLAIAFAIDSVPGIIGPRIGSIHWRAYIPRATRMISSFSTSLSSAFETAFEFP